jgi:hypothetical protein
MNKDLNKDYREKLKNRTQQAAANKDVRGGGKRSILNLSMLGLPVWVPKSGREKNVIDIMPWRITQEWYKNLRNRQGLATGLDIGYVDYKLEVPRHSNVGPGKDHMLCLREAWGKSDPICDDMFAEYAKRKEGGKFDKEKAKGLQPSWRNFYVIYDYDMDDKGFQLWPDVSYELFEKYLLTELKTAMDEGGMIVPWSLEDGKTVVFKGREKTLGSNKFIEAEGIAFEDRKPYDESVFAEIPSLDSALIIPTYEEVRAAHYGLDEEQGEREQEPSSPSQSQQESDTRTRTRTRGGSGQPTADQTPPETEKQGPQTVPSGRTRGETAAGTCPADGVFGVDCGRIQACKDEACSLTVYDACMKKHEELAKEEEVKRAEEAKKKEQPAQGTAGGTGTTARTRRR